MPHEVPLPPAFGGLEGKVRFVQRVSDTEYSATCPACGGDQHAGGEWPDRFRLFNDGHPRGWCRQCGLLWFPDMVEGYEPPSPQQIEGWRKEQERREEARRRSAERALENLRGRRLWEQYNQALGETGRGIWRKRGVPDGFIDYWQLGYTPVHEFYIHGQPWRTPTITIPLFDAAWQARNIKHRLLQPPEGTDQRYRYELSGQGNGPLFLCDPDNDLAGHVYVIEGEIKSMVTFARLDDSHTAMVGLPGKTPGPEVISTLQQAERVTLVVDQGAKKAGIDMARRIGVSRVWLLETGMKIDDALLAADMRGGDVARLLRGADRVSNFVTGRGRTV